MLEKAGLVIFPWSATAGVQHDENSTDPADSLPWVRQILDLDRTTVLGFAGADPELSGWLKWWRGRSFQIFEGIDASLLLTVRRPAGVLRMWQVCDAEEKRVGSFYRHALFDGLGYSFAQLEDGRPGRARKFATRAGPHIGSWELLADGAGRLMFAEPFNPFARMNLLAKVLTMPGLPGEGGG